MHTLKWFFLFFLVPVFIQAQPDDLSKMMEEEMASEPVTDYTTATFKTTRLINAHTNEQVAGGVLDMRISHRFGAINSGIQNFFGLDQAGMRVALEYGIFDWLMVGGGRSTYEKTYDSFLKAKLMRQSTSNRSRPLSINYFAAWQTKTIPFADPNRTNYFTSNFFFVHQLIVARKFNESLSLMIAPTLVHRNLVATLNDPHDLFSVVLGGRIKLTRRMSLNAEYIYQLPGTQPDGTTNSFSLGFDLETGGHVFQFSFTNSPAMIERAFIHETRGSWGKGDIITGFNLSRVFTLKDPRTRGKKKSETW